MTNEALLKEAIKLKKQIKKFDGQNELYTE